MRADRRGESDVVESGSASRITASMVVESTIGEVAVWVTVNAFVGGAESDNTPGRELELLLATLSGLAGLLLPINEEYGAWRELPPLSGDLELESFKYCKN